MEAVRHPRFVWHDLMTADVAGAQRFYGALFGWKFTGAQDARDPYLHLESRGVMFGGMVTLAQPGIPPHWIGYVEVADADACAQRAARCGGKLAVPPREIPGVGRFAVLVDPTGAHLAVFRSREQPAPERDVAPEDRRFCWDELWTTDPALAGAFYSELFGWQLQELPPGPQGSYCLFKRGALDAAGIMQVPPDAATPSHWLSYVAVPDVDDSAGTIRELGGKLRVEPRDIPGIGRFAVAADPQGASFAVFCRLTNAA